jgi:hypothetical protein
MPPKDQIDLDQYLTGERLCGDDFGLPEIEAWYLEEEEGYSSLIVESEYEPIP